MCPESLSAFRRDQCTQVEPAYTVSTGVTTTVSAQVALQSLYTACMNVMCRKLNRYSNPSRDKAGKALDPAPWKVSVCHNSAIWRAKGDLIFHNPSVIDYV